MLDWVQQFKSQFGDAVTTDMTALAIQGVEPACACAPESESQAAAMIRFAAAHRIPVVPYGGGSSQGRCAPPPRDFLWLSTSRLNKLVHHEPGDMVATVQAGAMFGAFQGELCERGQWLPLEARFSTVGGLVAANGHGPLASGYGTLRDMVLGMTVINGDGVIRKCGGKVVKNVTGYALDKLYISSFGTLGLITEVTFKLTPLSPDGDFLYAMLPDILTGVKALLKLAKKNLPVEMLQISIRTKAEGPILFICANGPMPELKRIRQELAQTVDLEFKENFFELRANSYSRELCVFINRDWYSYHGAGKAFFEYREPRTQGATLRFGCTHSSLEAAVRVINTRETELLSIGMTGGIIDLTPLTDSEAARIASEFEKLGVNFAFENIVGVNIPNRWGTPRPEWAIMKQIKAALDPQGIMNPGRFVV